MKRFIEWAKKPGDIVTEYFDAQERRQVVQALVTGVVVFLLCYPLKLLVHGGFHHFVELLPRGLAEGVVVVPLVLGSLVVAAIASYRPFVLHYQDDAGNLHELNAVEGDGLERAIALYFSSEPESRHALLGEQGVEVRWRMPTFNLALRKFAATLVTLCTGGSGGLEASVTLLGESAAAGLFKPRRLMPLALPGRSVLQRAWHWWRASDPDDLQTAQLCGIGAAIATLIGAPFAASFFAIEVMYRRRPIIDKLIYVLISSMVAFFLGHFVGAGSRLFGDGPFARPPVYSASYYVALLVVATAVSVAGIVFRRFRVRMDRWMRKGGRSVYARHALGAVGVGAVTILVATGMHFGSAAGWLEPSEQMPRAAELVLGPGESVLLAAIGGELTVKLAAVAFAGRFLATLLTITSGGSAGLLFPTLCFGALIATLCSAAFSLPAPVMLVAPAMTAALVSIANVPLAAILFVIELFGASYVVPSLFALVVASIIAHENNIYRTQREVLERGQILPGVSVRRVKVPAAWHGQDLRSLNVRQRFGLTVIGMIDRFQTDDRSYHQRTMLNPSPDQPLTEADTLIVLGEDESVDRFEAEARRA